MTWQPFGTDTSLLAWDMGVNKLCFFCLPGLTVAQRRPICKRWAVGWFGLVWFGLVWFSVPIGVNGKILIPTPHFVHSTLFSFLLCLLLLIAGILPIPRVKMYFVIEKKKVKSSCFSVSDSKSTMLHFSNFSKGDGELF